MHSEHDDQEKQAEELRKLTVENRALNKTIKVEREAYGTGLSEFKNQISEQMKEMKNLALDMRQVLSGSLRDVLKWRRDNGINDKLELSQIVQASRRTDCDQKQKSVKSEDESLLSVRQK